MNVYLSIKLYNNYDKSEEHRNLYFKFLGFFTFDYLGISEYYF